MEENKHMKRFLSILAALALVLSMAPASLAESAVEYIPAPYAIDEAKAGPTEYLAPVFYQNENGPTIGVTLVGVLKVDGLYFKDSDNDQELDAFEDWRLPVADRVADLLGKLTLDQRAGLMDNQMAASPASRGYNDVVDENGKVLLDKLMVVTEGDVYSYENTEANSTGIMLGNESRSGVVRFNNGDARVMALWNNATQMVAEYAAVAKNEPAVPFNALSNPISNGEPGTNGMAAAAMADGNYDLIKKFAELDRIVWNAKGIDEMYGPQIDLITDARWNRNNGTYTEVPEVNAGIVTALVTGYQNGTDGAQDGDVGLIMKHFPGDGAAENGFESHNKVGEWRIYATEGSLEKYQLVGFQAAVDAGVAGIMPGYSRPATDGRSAKQTYRGVEINPEEIGNAYNSEIIGKLLYDVMGFTGFINTDSGIITVQYFGVADEVSVPEKAAMIINAGSDTGANMVGAGAFRAAIQQGLINQEAYDRATTRRLTALMQMNRFDNPYRDPEQSAAEVEAVSAELTQITDELQHKSVVLLKNHEATLPLTDNTKKVYVQSFESGVVATGWGATNAASNSDQWKALFEGAGYTLVEDYKEADIVLLDIVPGGVVNNGTYMNTVNLVDEEEVPERKGPASQEKTGETTTVTTLQDVKSIKKIAKAVHENGGKVIAAVNFSSPWILENLEPYCDAIIGQFSSKVTAQFDVVTGAFAPVGKMPFTLPANEAVLAVNEVEIDGVVREVCVSPNDVPGFEKDQYMSADVLAQSPSGSYAYQDADGNLYKAFFGLTY